MPPEPQRARHVKFQRCNCATRPPQELGAVSFAIRAVPSDTAQAPSKIPSRQRGCFAPARVNDDAGLGPNQFPHVDINTPNPIQKGVGEKKEKKDRGIETNLTCSSDGPKLGLIRQASFCREAIAIKLWVSSSRSRRPVHREGWPSGSEPDQCQPTPPISRSLSRHKKIANHSRDERTHLATNNTRVGWLWSAAPSENPIDPATSTSARDARRAQPPHQPTCSARSSRHR